MPPLPPRRNGPKCCEVPHQVSDRLFLFEEWMPQVSILRPGILRCFKYNFTRSEIWHFHSCRTSEPMPRICSKPASSASRQSRVPAISPPSISSRKIGTSYHHFVLEFVYKERQNRAGFPACALAAPKDGAHKAQFIPKLPRRMTPRTGFWRLWTACCPEFPSPDGMLFPRVFWSHDCNSQPATQWRRNGFDHSLQDKGTWPYR